MGHFIEEIEESIIDFSIHEYCCRIIQRMLEKCHPKYVHRSCEIILQNFYYLSKNEYGIFVLSSMLENCEDSIKTTMLMKIKGTAAHVSMQKDGSKLIENAIKMIEKINGKHK